MLRGALGIPLLFGLLGCQQCRESASPGTGPLVRGLLALQREAHRDGVAPHALLPDDEALARLGRLSGEVRARLAGRHPVDALNQIVFEEAGYHRKVDDLSLESVLLARVLERKRGSCVGLGGLYLALGETLDLPLQGVLVPGHFFVRYKGDAGSRDVELLKRGARMPLSWYREKYNVPAKNPLYLTRTLDLNQTLAVYRYNLANDLRSRGRHRTALSHYRQVVAVLPSFAEAWANMGLTLHRLRRLGDAEQAYVRAKAAHPELAGVEHNLQVLRKEMKGPTSSPGRP